MLTAVAPAGVCAGDDCPYPPPPGVLLCNRCVGELRSALRAVPEVMGELLITATRQDVGMPGMGGGSSEPPLLYRPDATDAGRDLHAVLEVWTDHVARALGYTLHELRLRASARPDIRRLPRGVAGPERPPVPGQATYEERKPIDTTTGRFPDNDTLELAMWLDRHLETIRRDDTAVAAVAEIANAVDRCWYACDRPGARIYLGRCDTCVRTPTAVEDRPPDRAIELWAHPDTPVVTCTWCGTRYDVEVQRGVLLAAAESRYVTAELASRALPVLINGDITLTPEVIRGWVRTRGLVAHEPPASDKAGRRRYLVRDLLDQISAARARAAERVRPPLHLLPPELVDMFDAARRAAAAPVSGHTDTGVDGG